MADGKPTQGKTRPAPLKLALDLQAGNSWPNGASDLTDLRDDTMTDEMISLGAKLRQHAAFQPKTSSLVGQHAREGLVQAAIDGTTRVITSGIVGQEPP